MEKVGAPGHRRQEIGISGCYTLKEGTAVSNGQQSQGQRRIRNGVSGCCLDQESAAGSSGRQMPNSSMAGCTGSAMHLLLRSQALKKGWQELEEVRNSTSVNSSAVNRRTAEHGHLGDGMHATCATSPDCRSAQGAPGTCHHQKLLSVSGGALGKGERLII